MATNNYKKQKSDEKKVKGKKNNRLDYLKILFFYIILVPLGTFH